MHKKTGKICAIKRIPTETDIEELKKEILILKECVDSDYIVKYLGSYIYAAENELWVYIYIFKFHNLL